MMPALLIGDFDFEFRRKKYTEEKKVKRLMFCFKLKQDFQTSSK